MTQILAASPSAYWYLMRGSGIVSVTLLTLVSVLGVATALNWSVFRLPRFATQTIHRSISLASLIFLAIHVATAVADTYVAISLKDVLIPFASGYKPLETGLGALVLDIMLVLIVTSLLRDHIGVRAWRTLHWAAYACLPIALLHAFLIGSDRSRTWLLALYAVEAITALAVTGIRVFAVSEKSPQQRFEQSSGRRGSGNGSDPTVWRRRVG